MKAYCPVCKELEDTVIPPTEDPRFHGTAMMAWWTPGGDTIASLVICANCGIAYDPTVIVRRISRKLEALD